jgi:hypothetical protein
MKTEPKLFFIKADGTVEEVPASDFGSLEYGSPRFEYMRPKIGCDTIEHLSVWYQNKPAHLFFDEEGLLGDPEEVKINAKATAIHANTVQRRSGPRAVLMSYNDINKEPLPAAMNFAAYGTLIVGNALLWTGDME